MFLMIKNTLAQFISICECMFDTLVWLKFHKELFDFNEDVYMFIISSSAIQIANETNFPFVEYVVILFSRTRNNSQSYNAW
jgi:hypothetical protein